MNDPRISIILVNWNGKNDTLECLESVWKIDYPNFQVIVVDNGSRDDSVSAVRKKFPEAIVIETGKNLGFAGGNNVGLRYALENGIDYVFLLNNDTIVDPQVLKNFVYASLRVGSMGIFGAKIYYYSEPNKIWYAGARWVREASEFGHLGYRCIDDGRDFNALSETDYACGCALFVHSEVLKIIGLFDERFFIICEETDLCYRARSAGIKSFFVPEAKVWHKISTTFGGENSPSYQYFYMRNKLLWAEKNLPFSQRLMLYRKVLREVLRIIANGKLNHPMNKSKLWGLRDYLLRRYGNRPELIRSLKSRD